jgi:hypothetical protein
MCKRLEFQIEKIVAAYDGDLHGALRALMLVKEYLEGELVAMHAPLTTSGRSRRRTNTSLN